MINTLGSDVTFERQKMKLSEIKTSLIDQFFTEGSIGVPQDQLDPIFESIGKNVGLDLNSERLVILQEKSNQSNDPSKAFKRFTDGRVSLLTIVEEDSNVILAAVRSGTSIRIADLTITPITERDGSLLSVKNALRQAKNRNDDVFFNIIVTDKD
jgi:sugar diacid utilization regulator